MNLLATLKTPSVEAAFQENNVARAFIFGSFARGQETEKSDIDIIYERRADRPLTLLNIGNLRSRLREATSREIDLVSTNAIRSDIRSGIESEKICIFDTL